MKVKTQLFHCKSFPVWLLTKVTALPQMFFCHQFIGFLEPISGFGSDSGNYSGREWSSLNLPACCSFIYIFHYFISFPASEKKKEFVYSHPKLKKLEEIVIDHFKSWKQRCSGEHQQLRGKPVTCGRRLVLFLLIILLKPDIFQPSRWSQERRLSWGHEGDDFLLVPGQRAGNRGDAGAAPPGRAGHDLRGTLLREKHQRLHPEGAAGGEERGGLGQELVMKSINCVNNSRGMDCVAGDEL